VSLEVLMDVQTPWTGGYEATAGIRFREAAGDGRQVSTIAMSAEPMQGDGDKPVEAGMDVGRAHMEAPIDREVLARLRGLQGEDEPDIVAKLAGVFLDDARSRLQAVEEALQQGDATTVQRVAHMLKGGSGSMGARGMFDLCAQLEDIGSSGDLSRGSGLLERIREELGRVDRALEAEVSGSRNSGRTGRLR
jgi:two-component system, sensor histidine kinase and response regulator